MAIQFSTSYQSNADSGYILQLAIKVEVIDVKLKEWA